MKKTCICGHSYWPAQSWVHKDCSVNHQEEPKVVVNDVANAVVNARSKDRHKKTQKRLDYVKQKMREYRARK